MRPIEECGPRLILVHFFLCTGTVFPWVVQQLRSGGILMREIAVIDWTHCAVSLFYVLLKLMLTDAGLVLAANLLEALLLRNLISLCKDASRSCREVSGNEDANFLLPCFDLSMSCFDASSLKDSEAPNGRIPWPEASIPKLFFVLYLVISVTFFGESAFVANVVVNILLLPWRDHSESSAFRSARRRGLRLSVEQ